MGRGLSSEGGCEGAGQRRWIRVATDDRRRVTVPLHDELRTGTLRSIAENAGARDFDAFCDWLDDNA